jgi:hypothetical protein
VSGPALKSFHLDIVSNTHPFPSIPQGKLNDGVNSMTRYVINNFYDGLRQVLTPTTLLRKQGEVKRLTWVL